MKKTLIKITQTTSYSWIMIALGAILFSIGLNAFISTAGVFPTGLMSFGFLVVYLSPVNINAYLSLIYLGLNVPIIWFFWKKVKRRYIYKTMFFIFVQAAFGLIFLFPEIRNIPASFFWNDKTIEEIREFRWPILLFSALGAMIASAGMGLSWKYGGSTGGTDIVTYFYSFKHKKPIGKINLIVSLTMMATSFIISISLNKPYKIRELWFIMLLGTLIYLFILVTIVDLIYPKYSKVKLDIYSSNPDQISKHLKIINFPHSWSIMNLESGYTGQKKKVISTTILLLELKDLVKELSKIDPKIWINVMQVKMNYGNFNTQSVDYKN